jgi:hypothetical protein
LILEAAVATAAHANFHSTSFLAPFFLITIIFLTPIITINLLVPSTSPSSSCSPQNHHHLAPYYLLLLLLVIACLLAS